ncbi:MAG: ATP-binding protein [Methylocystaceae bacterium]|nr:ATP-binding protein [Methylocystaceae bacterium]
MFSPIPDLKIGKILEVSGTSIRVDLDENVKELTRSHNGHVYAIGQMATVVKIHFARRVIFAFVRLLRMKSEVFLEEGRVLPDNSPDSSVLEADLFGEGTWDRHLEILKFDRGVNTYPLPQQGVYLTTQEEIKALYQGAENTQEEDGPSILASIGTYSHSSSTSCNANIDKLFGQHCAVLGSTGSGKSGTVAALLHAVLESQEAIPLKPRVIIMDPHGEYGDCFGDRSKTYHAYDAAVEGEKTSELKLPYWLMTGEEFRSMVIGKTEREATSQNNIVYAALAHARMVEKGMVAAVQENDFQSDDFDPHNPTPIGGFKVEDIISFDRDTPLPFKLSEFEKHILHHQSYRKSKDKWTKISATDFKSHQSILNKLAVLKADPRIRFMIDEDSAMETTLENVVSQFVGVSDPTQDIRVIDISGLPNEVAGPLTALIARLLFQYKVWQTREEREKDPVLFVCEEAHRYVPSSGEAEYADAQRAVQRIAKEGRKYGLGLMLVSQRPSDVDSTVISQCNSWIILRLTNGADQDHIRRYLPDNLAGMSRMLPTLARGEALFVGEAATIPARIKIRHLEKRQLPRSQDISFVKGWADIPENNDHIQAVINRWQKQ